MKRDSILQSIKDMESFEYVLEDKTYKTEGEMQVDNLGYDLIEISTYGDYAKRQKKFMKGVINCLVI
jgi:hypothetical protein